MRAAMLGKPCKVHAAYTCLVLLLSSQQRHSTGGAIRDNAMFLVGCTFTSATVRLCIGYEALVWSLTSVAV